MLGIPKGCKSHLAVVSNNRLGRCISTNPHDSPCNKKQLQLAWHQYTLDNNDALPPSMTLGAPGDRGMPGCWVLGNAQRDSDITNLQSGVLYKYVGGVGVYRCPADKSTVQGKPGVPRLRSYSMNFWLNADRGNVNPSNTPEDKTRASQLIDPSPSELFVFGDEDHMAAQTFDLAHHRITFVRAAEEKNCSHNIAPVKALVFMMNVEG